MSEENDDEKAKSSIGFKHRERKWIDYFLFLFACHRFALDSMSLAHGWIDSMTRTFIYRFEDGTEMEHSSLHLNQLEWLEENHGKCTYNGWAEFMGVGKPSTVGIIGGAHTKGDGFKTGWNSALGMEIKSPSHFKQVLKEKGLREVGNEKPMASAPKTKSYINEDVIKEAVSMGAEIGDAAAEALIAGKSLSDDSVKVIE